MHTHTHMHPCTHARTHARTHTHTHTHAHTQTTKEYKHVNARIGMKHHSVEGFLYPSSIEHVYEQPVTTTTVCQDTGHPTVTLQALSSPMDVAMRITL